MENFILIASIILLFLLGFIPVIKWDRFIGARNRVKEVSPNKSRKRCENAELLEEYERTGVLLFESRSDNSLDENLTEKDCKDPNQCDTIYEKQN